MTTEAAPITEPTTPTTAPTTESFSVPEQYADRSWAGNVKSLDDVYSQFDNAQSMLGKKTVPGPDATDEQLQDFYSQLRPETLEGYELSMPEGVEAEINADEQNVYKQMFHDIGLTPKQANALFQGHVKIEMDKASKLAEGQQSEEQINEAFDKALGEKYGDKADDVVKIVLQHALQHSDETKQIISGLNNDQLLAVVDLTYAMHGKIPSRTEDGAPQGGETIASQSLDEKVREANKMRISKEIKDPFHPESTAMREKLKALDASIQQAYK